MKQVRLAAIVAAILVILSAVSFADTPTGDGTLQPTGQQTAPAIQEQEKPVGKVEAPTATPAPPSQDRTPYYETREGHDEASRRVLRGDFALRNHTHRLPRIPNLAKAVQHQINKRHLVSRWQAKQDAAELMRKHNKAKQVKKTLTAGKASVSKTSPQRDRPLPWWFWPLVVPPILLALFVLDRRSRRRSRKSKPESEPVKPASATVVSKVGGRFRGRNLPGSTIECAEETDGTKKLVEILKAVKDIDGPNPGWQWVTSGDTLYFKYTPGGRLRFQISIVNHSRREIPTAGIVITDLFRAEGYQPVPGSGRVGIHTKEIGSLDDAFVRQLISGVNIEVDKIIDALPAYKDKTEGEIPSGVGRLNLIYDAEPIDTSESSLPMGGGGILDNKGPVASAEPMFRLHPEPTEPPTEVTPAPTPSPAPEPIATPAPTATATTSAPEPATVETETTAVPAKSAQPVVAEVKTTPAEPAKKPKPTAKPKPAEETAKDEAKSPVETSEKATAAPKAAKQMPSFLGGN